MALLTKLKRLSGILDLARRARAQPATSGAPPVERRTPRAVAPDRILVVDWKPPTPDRDSGSYRMNMILECLVDAGLPVDFVGDREAETPEYAARLRARGISVRIGWDEALQHLSLHGSEYRAALLVRPEVFEKYGALVRTFAFTAKLVYHTVDLHWVRFSRGAALASDPTELRERAEQYRKLEIASARSADAVIAITEDERQTLLREVPGLDVGIVPNIHDLAEHVAPLEARRDLLFIGGFDHQPNVDAVQHFVSAILPLVIRELPDVRLRIVGSNLPPTIKALEGPNVVPVGYLADVEPCFQESRVFVAPLRHGAGMKGKIGQSLSFGLPVVTTSIGAEGIGLVDGASALIADEPEAFAAAVVGLYSDAELWVRLSDAGRDIIRRKFSRQSVQQQLLQLLNS